MLKPPRLQNKDSASALRKSLLASVYLHTLMISRQPKNGKTQPKTAIAKPSTNGTADGTGRHGRNPRRGRNAGRPKSKTADELDMEMTDYFDKPANGGSGATADGAVNGAAPATTGGDEIGMDDIS